MTALDDLDVKRAKMKADYLKDYAASGAERMKLVDEQTKANAATAAAADAVRAGVTVTPDTAKLEKKG